MGGAGELIQNTRFRVGVRSAALTLSGLFTAWIFNGAAPVNWTLPLLSGPLNQFVIKNRGTAILTIVRSGTDELYDTAAATNLVLLPGDSYTIINDKTYWVVTP